MMKKTLVVAALLASSYASAFQLKIEDVTGVSVSATTVTANVTYIDDGSTGFNVTAAQGGITIPTGWSYNSCGGNIGFCTVSGTTLSFAQLSGTTAPGAALGTVTFNVTGLTAGTTYPLTAVGNYQVQTDGTTGDQAATGVSGSVTVSGMTVTPNPHDYGTVLQGSVNTQVFTVTNSGVVGGITLGATFASFTFGTDLTLAGIATGPSATACANNLAIADGNACDFEVTWTPTATGTLNDPITVFSDANNVTVGHTGTSILNDAQLGTPVTVLSNTTPFTPNSGIQPIGTLDITNAAQSPITEALKFANCSLSGDTAVIAYGGTTLANLDGLSIPVNTTSATTGNFTCDTTATPGNYSVTLACDTSDNNVADNAATTGANATVGTINCAIGGPIYASSPDAAGSTINLTSGGTVEIGTPAPTYTLEVGNTGTDPLTVANGGITLTSTSTDFTYTVNGNALPWSIPGGTNAVGSGYTVAVDCTPTTPDVTQTATLTITDNASGSPHQYTFQCTGKATSVLSLNPADAGTVTVGPNVGTTTATVTVSNTGNEALSIDSCTLDAALAPPNSYNCQVITGLPISVAAGASQDITVQCDLAQGDSVTQANGLQCTFSGDFNGTNVAGQTQLGTWTMNLIGAVFVIPALNGFGLMLLALTLLVAGGVMVRRRA